MTVVATHDLVLVKGEDNFFDIDLSADLDAADEIWFTAKYRKSDVDADAALSLTRGSGIIDVDTAAGKAQIKVTRAQATGLQGRALVYDVKVRKADVDQVTTVVTGVIRMIETTRHSTV